MTNKFTNKIKDLFNKAINYGSDNYDFTLGTSTNPIVNDAKDSKDGYQNLTLDAQNINNEPKNINVYPSIELNLDFIKTKYNSLINSDVVIREFTLTARNRQYKAFIVFIDGMTNQDSMDNYILKPLMLRNSANSYENDEKRIISEVKTNNIIVRKIKKFNIVDYINNCLLPQNNIKQEKTFSGLIEGINVGNCALFIDTLGTAFNIEVKGFEKRSLDKPNNEMVVKGPQVGFTENLRTNTSLLRRFVNNENLIIESLNIGKISKTACAVCYLKNVANSDLIAEVKYRINNLDIDYLISTGQLEQLIQDNGNLSLPQMLATERPDRAANMLFGRTCCNNC